MSRWPDHTFAQRLHAKIDVSGGPDACHPWTGARTPKGYGHLWNDEHRTVQAHREVWIEANGPIPAATPFVLHSCDNPSCCNLRHLSVGTNADNVRDMYAKGRGSWKGKPCIALTDADRDAMRAMRARGVFLRDIAKQFGASYGATRSAVMEAA